MHVAISDIYISMYHFTRNVFHNKLEFMCIFCVCSSLLVAVAKLLKRIVHCALEAKYWII